jgi:hypothetical protein
LFALRRICDGRQTRAVRDSVFARQKHWNHSQAGACRTGGAVAEQKRQHTQKTHLMHDQISRKLTRDGVKTSELGRRDIDQESFCVEEHLRWQG